eukprot:1129402-Ditylum_brightwellii.AAC.1
MEKILFSVELSDPVEQSLPNRIAVCLGVFYFVPVVPTGSGKFPCTFNDFLSQRDCCPLVSVPTKCNVGPSNPTLVLPRKMGGGGGLADVV